GGGGGRGGAGGGRGGGEEVRGEAVRREPLVDAGDGRGVSRLGDDAVGRFLDHVLIRGCGEPPGDGAVARGRVGVDERRERRGPHFIARVSLEGGARQLRGSRTTQLAQRRYCRSAYLRRGITQRRCERRRGARRG